MRIRYFRRAVFLVAMDALLVTSALVGSVKAQPAIRLCRDWRHAPLGAVLTVNSTLLDFGAVEIGDSQDLTFMMSNASEQDIQVGIDMVAPPFSSDLSDEIFILPAGASQTCTVRFTPTIAGKAFGVVSIFSSRGAARVELRGKAIRPRLDRH